MKLLALFLGMLMLANTASAEPPGGPKMVTIPEKNYEIGKYLVTQGEWRAVMANNPSHFNSCGDTCPVENVSWGDAREFIQKLNATTGKQYRLPTEDEWEYACYGGNQIEYCGGKDPDAIAWFRGNSQNKTHPVGLKQANGYGLYDMSGNVWEWMETLYDDEHDWRAICGGSWYSNPNDLSHVNCKGSAPGNRSVITGLRLARTLP